MEAIECTVLGETYKFYEDDSSFEEGEGLARQTNIDVFEVIGDKTHFALSGFDVRKEDIEAAIELLVTHPDDYEIGVTYSLGDIGENITDALVKYFNEYPHIIGITIHP